MEGDPVGMAEISQFVSANPNAVNDLAKCLKARVKDSNEDVSFISLHVLDECMKMFNFTFQAQVQKSMLKRLAIMAQPYGGYPAKLQEKTASLLVSWGQLYGSDPRLEKFKVAGAQVRKREVQEVAGACKKDELKEERSELKEVQRVAREADIKEIQTAMLEMGVAPEIAAYAAAEHNAAREQQKQSQNQGQGRYAMAGSDLGPDATVRLPSARPDRVPPSRPLLPAEPPAPPSAPVEDASETALQKWRVLQPKAREHAELLAAMMQGVSPEALASNTETTELATQCVLLQNNIREVSAALTEEAEIVACVGVIEDLASVYKEWVAKRSNGFGNSNGIHKSAMLESESSFLGQHEACD